MRHAFLLRPLLSAFAVLIAVSPLAALADDAAPAVPAPELTATIIGPDDTPLNRTIILDASASRIVGSNVQYQWFVDSNPEPISTTVDAIFTPDKPGVVHFRLVIRSTVDGSTKQDEVAHIVTVFQRKIVLIADTRPTDAELANLQHVAASGATYLRVLRSPVSAVDRGGEDALTGLLTEKGTALQDSESIILWIDGIPTPGLHALIQAVNGDVKRERSMQEQTLLLVTDQNLRTIARSAKGPMAQLKAKRVLVTRQGLLSLLLSSKNDTEFAQKAFQLPSEQPQILDAAVVQVPAWALLTRLVNDMLSRGVSSQTVLLLLVLPVIATILSFLKQIVGMTTFGLFTPAIIALSFLVLGWTVGLLFLAFILMTGYASRAMMRRLHILYIPKMAIILGIGAITLLLLVGIGTQFGVLLSHDTVFVLLIMSTLVESFLNVKSEQGLKSAIFAIGQTVLAALLCVLLVQWPPFRALIIAYPETILLTIIVNILLGRWTGLRISEYFRFREVFKHLVQE